MQRASALNCPVPPARLPSGLKEHRLSALEDEGIARLAERGSRRAFAALYERHQGKLYTYCHLLLQDDEDTYDALQSTLTRALAALRRGERDQPLRPWLFRIAHDEATSLIRARAAAQDLRETSKATEQFMSVEDRAEERARLSLLVADLRELPDVQRSALLMRELSGLSHEEIATALDISAHGARQAIFHARRSLVEFHEGRSLACEEVRRTLSRDDGRTVHRRSVRAHLRDCGSCTAFGAAIPQRRADLHALAPPLAPALATGLLAQLSQLGSGHGTGGLSVGAAKTVGGSLAAKALAVTAVAVTAVTGLGSVTVIRHHARHPAAARPAPAQSAGGTPHRRVEARGADSSGGRPQSAPRGQLDGDPGASAAGLVPLGPSAADSADEGGAGPAGRIASPEDHTAAAQRPIGTLAGAPRPATETTAGRSGAPHAHGTGPTSGSPRSDHAAVEAGVPAHLRATNAKAIPGHAGGPSAQEGAAASDAPGQTGSMPSSEPPAPVLEGTPPSAQAGTPSANSAGGQAPPSETGASAGAGASPAT